MEVLASLIWKQMKLTLKSARHFTEEKSVHANHADQSLSIFLNRQHRSGPGHSTGRWQGEEEGGFDGKEGNWEA